MGRWLVLLLGHIIAAAGTPSERLASSTVSPGHASPYVVPPQGKASTSIRTSEGYTAVLRKPVSSSLFARAFVMARAITGRLTRRTTGAHELGIFSHHARNALPPKTVGRVKRNVFHST